MELSTLELDRQAWDPNPDSELLDVYDRFNVPTMGLLRISGERIFFRCIAGHGAPRSLWMYVPGPTPGEPFPHHDPLVGIDGWFASVTADRMPFYAEADDSLRLRHVEPGKEIHPETSLIVEASRALSIPEADLIEFGIDADSL